MHRIDSATARANVNGKGKTGFSDNGDLPNQDATYFTPAWANSVQEELSNVIETSGLKLDKKDNGQLLKALSKRFAEKQKLEQTITDSNEAFRKISERLVKLEKRTYEDTQVGEHIWIDRHFLTPDEVAEYKGYGKWERALQGRVAVGYSDNPDDLIEFRTPGAEYGENEHVLTVEETAPHTHIANIHGGSIGGNTRPGTQNTSAGGGNIETDSAGGGKAHNNIQQSKTLDCWKRVE